MSYIYFFKLRRMCEYCLFIICLTFNTFTKYGLFLEIYILDGYSYAFQITNAKGKGKKTRYKIWVDKWKR